MTTDECLDAIWKELTSGRTLTERKREAQSAFTQLHGIVKAAERHAKEDRTAGSLRATFRKSGIEL